MNTAKKPLDIQLDEYGLLKYPECWNRDVAQRMATDLGIGFLTPDHWQVIEALRQHYSRFGVAPAMHNICRSSNHSEDWVHNLFQSCLNAWRVAGLPDPGEEAKTYLNDM